MGGADSGQFRESFGRFLRTIGGLLNTDPIEKQFGKADVYDNSQIISTDNSRIPGSRAKGKGNPRDGANEENELEEKQM